MVTREHTVVTDDLDGSEGAQTYRLAWGDREVELDLSPENAGDLEEVLAPYLAVGRPASGAARSRPRPARPAPAAEDRRSDLAQVREWARAQGYQVSERGRIAQHVLEAYDAS